MKISNPLPTTKKPPAPPNPPKIDYNEDRIIRMQNLVERLTDLLLDREATIEAMKQEIKQLKEQKKTIEIG